MPKVSINIITYNRSELLTRAVASVLRQSFKDLEVIIFINNSTDDTEQKLRALNLDSNIFRIHISKESLSITEARSRALKISEGEYVAVLDDDDVWLDREKLEKQVRFLENNPLVSVLGTWAEMVDANGDKIGILKPPVTNDQIKNTILLRCPFVHSSVVFRKQIALGIGGYSLKEGIAEDYDLWLRMGKVSELANLPEEMVLYQVHNASVSKIKKFLGVYSSCKLVLANRKNYSGFYRFIIVWLFRLIKSAIWLKFR